MQLEICLFINKHPNWEAKLSEPPYCVKTKREMNFILLKYNQIQSDMSISLVRECRGIILDEAEGYRPLCVPFFKFGNYGEAYVPKIDWSTARVQEKLDGSLIKLWFYKDKWHVSSNGEIDASNAHISSALLPSANTTDLFTLFSKAWEETGVDINSLNRNYIYMFELTSPHNRVVVRYNHTAIHHIGTREINTLKECDLDIGIQKPQEFSIRTLYECIDSAKQLGYDHEGYVVVDSSFNRVKVKSPLYVALNHISQGVTTHGNVLEMIRKNEQDEFLSYFPEFGEVFIDIQNRIDSFVDEQTASLQDIQCIEYHSRKELAEVVTKTLYPACLFSLIDGKFTNAREWLLSRPTAKALEYIGLR